MKLELFPELSYESISYKSIQYQHLPKSFILIWNNMILFIFDVYARDGLCLRLKQKRKIEIFA